MTGDAGTDARRRRVAVIASLTVLLAVFVALVGALAVGGETGAFVALGALTLLFTAVGTGLLLIARRVGSKADDPEEVERRMAESLGLSEERTQLRVDRVAGEVDAVPEQGSLDERYDAEESDPAGEALDARFYEDDREEA